MDGLVSSAIIIMTLEAARRVVGMPLVIMSILAILYAVFGFIIPGEFGHRGFDFLTVATHSVLSLEGVMGIPLAVASTFIFVFVLFASFLRSTGLGEFFINFAVSLVGTSKGAPAQVAVISSGFLGTISGSSTANVVGTGSFTIPLMKSLGYKPEFAGGVEAASSTGGQLMPPIMGAAAFIMAEFLGISYLKIAIAAFFPSFLYFLSIILIVRKEAMKSGVKPMPKDQIPNLIKLLRYNGHLLLPLIVIVYVLLSGYTPLYAGLMGVISAYLVSFLRASTRLSFKELLHTLRQGAEDAILISAACACCGVIIGVVTLTGAGLKIGYGIVALAGGTLFLTLIFTMLTSILLGMGVPTTANYIITSTTAAPALGILNVPALAAHMFVFYFGILADITPPVAIASYTASGVARANPMKTAVNATRLAFVAFLVPFFFVYNTHLLLIEVDILNTSVAMITAIVGIYSLASALSGYWRIKLNIYERIPLFAAALALLDKGYLSDIIGCAMIFATWIYLYKKDKSSLRKAQVLSSVKGN
jgi:TRAP transporter 4TM/12TM fusion protein